MTITLEELETRQAELAAAIEQLKTANTSVMRVQVPATDIALAAGEHYAGTVLLSNGQISHHLVLMAPRPKADMAWSDAVAWSAEVGGVLPNRQEQALLFANCRHHIKPVWHWSSEQHEDDASYAWRQHFLNGGQYYTRKSAQGAAVAVRRVTA
jgi:hypothetical protein